MGKEFLSGYSRLVTGEKDPRNLRTAFSIARVILVEFEISENVEVSSRSVESAVLFPYRMGCRSCRVLLLLTLTAAAGSVRHNLLLFSNHLHAASQRSLWHHERGAAGSPQVSRPSASERAPSNISSHLAGSTDRS